MQITTCRIMQIDNGYIVEVYPKPTTGTIPGTPVNQYCADLNTVASYLVSTFVPGGTYTPPPA